MNYWLITQTDADLARTNPPTVRPAFPVLPIMPPGPGVTKAQQSVFDIQTSTFSQFYGALAEFKQLVVSSLEDHVRDTLQPRQAADGHLGIAHHTVQELLEYLMPRYSVLTGTDITNIWSEINSKRSQNVTDFMENATLLKRLFALLTRSGKPVPELLKIAALSAMISPVPELLKAFTAYEYVAPLPADQTLAAAIDYIHARAKPNASPTSGSLGFAGGAAASGGAPPVGHGGGRGRGGRGAGRVQAGRGRGRGRNAQPVAGAGAPASATIRLYCFEHGYNWSHPSHRCNVMGVPSYNATAPMLAATAPATIDGYVGCADVAP